MLIATFLKTPRQNYINQFNLVLCCCHVVEKILSILQWSYIDHISSKTYISNNVENSWNNYAVRNTVLFLHLHCS